MSTRTSLRTLASVTQRSASTSTSTSTSTIPPPPPDSDASSSSSTSQNRIYPPRKSFLHAYYDHLLRTSQLVLLFSHDNLTVSNLLSIRRAIAKIPAPPSSSQSDPTEPQRATLTIARTGLLSSSFKPSSNPADLPSLLPYLNGPTALITSPSLSPSYLSKLLSSINRSIRQSQKEAPQDRPKPR